MTESSATDESGDITFKVAYDVIDTATERVRRGLKDAPSEQQI
jgi:hypothetical protein